MTRLARYVKPFVLGMAAVLLLLFVQAVCDLNLPNYMSRIVNVGIQQQGIEKGAPDAITGEGYAFITTFMTDQERALVEAAYTPKSGADRSGDGRPYEDIYPAAASREIYVLESGIDDDSGSGLDLTFGTAAWTMINVLKSLAGEDGSGGDMESMDMQSADIALLYGMQPVLEQLPRQVFDTARQQALSMDHSLLMQSGTMLTGVFYRELGMDLAAYQRGYITRVGLFMLLIALGGGLATVLVGLIASRIAAAVARNLRYDIFQKIGSFSQGEHDRFSTASLITRSTNDVIQIQMLLTFGIRMIFYAPILGTGGVIMALEKSVSMGWIIALACIVLVGLILVIFSLVMPKFRMMQKFIDRLNLVARETLNGLMVIRAFGTGNFEKERFDNANEDLTGTNLFVNRAMVFTMPAMMLIMNGVVLLIIWVGAHRVAESQMQVGDMMAFMQYAMQIIMSFLMISMMFIFIPRASVSAQRISEVLQTEPAIIDPLRPVAMKEAGRGSVEFRNVSFRYAGAEEDALKNISFTARPGETTAFIGSTGAGKTTIINLIPRFYDASGGEVLVNGINVKELAQKELRSRIGYVPQKSVLMSGTVESNIRYGNGDIAESEMTRIAAVAQALEFINEKEGGFQSEIAQGGANVSGGQKQRLSIARALAVKPDIYIFDDSFSALDFRTDANLRKALKAYTGESTVIIVTQRVSTIMEAEQIYVIDGGAIVGRGRHRDLLQSCPEYYEIASSQLTPEELSHAQ